MSFEGEIDTTERHDVGSGCTVSETSLGSSLRGSQTSLPSLPPPYDGHQASLAPSSSLQPRGTAQTNWTQRPRSLYRRSPRPFQRSNLPEDGTRQGTVLQLEEEGVTELNAEWKKQMRADRLALNALIEANQKREANAVPDKDDGNEDDLSNFNSRYQEYLGRRGLSNVNEFTRHMERLFDEL